MEDFMEELIKLTGRELLLLIAGLVIANTNAPDEKLIEFIKKSKGIGSIH